MADCRLMAATRCDYVGTALTGVRSLLMLMPSVRARLIFPAAIVRSTLRANSNILLLFVGLLINLTRQLIKNISSGTVDQFSSLSLQSA